MSRPKDGEPSEADARPGVDRIGGRNEVHPRCPEAIECLFGLRAVVVDDRTRHRVLHHDGRGAVLEQVDLLGHLRILGLNLTEQVVDRPRHAVRLRLTSDDQGVVAEQLLDEADVARNRRAVAEGCHLRTENRVVLDQRMRPLDLDARLGPTDHTVESDSLGKTGDEGVPLVTKDAVVRPDGQGVAPVLLQLSGVVLDVPLRGHERDAEGRRHERVRPPDAIDDILVRDHGERCRVVALYVHPEQRVEDGVDAVRVECRADVGQHTEVPVDELYQTPRVIDCTSAGHATDVQLAVRVTEGVLDIDREQANAELVRGSRLDVVARTEVVGFRLKRSVVDPTVGYDVLRVVEVGIGQVGGHDRILSHLISRSVISLLETTWIPPGPGTK